MESPSAGDSSSRETGCDRAWFWSLWAVIAAFGCYFCMYAFRKPFTAATYTDGPMGSLGFKSLLVICQVSGYALSKFLGIKVIAEMPFHRRAISILFLIAAAHLSLLGFALVPRPWSAACLFLNGLALGMVFGLVLGVLEGRRQTEALAAGLCASFILADGVMKSVGAWLLQQGVSEPWMPFVAGVIFLGPLGLFTAMLHRVPPPTNRDRDARSVRTVMYRQDRLEFLWRHATVLAPLTIMYLLVTILRTIRADFAPEIWHGLGAAAAPSTFSQSETWVMLGVVIVNGSCAWIRDNSRAFLVSLVTCGLGFVLLAAALAGHASLTMSPFGFMVCLGLGLYLPYVAIHTTVFERMLALTRDRGNIGFMMYLVDSIGYLGVIAVLLISQRDSRIGSDQALNLLISGGWVTTILSVGCLLVVMISRRSTMSQRLIQSPAGSP